MLAKSKINTIRDLISKALRDGQIDDKEFSLNLKEIDKYEILKGEIRQKASPVKKNEDLRNQIDAEVVEEVRKKLG